MTLPAGTYWLDWASTATGAVTTSFYPTRVIAGARMGSEDDASQQTVSSGVWAYITDDGSPPTAPDVRQDFPFNIHGTGVGSPTATVTETFTPTNTATSTNTATPTPTATANPNCSFSNGGLNPQANAENGTAAPAGFFWSEVQHDTGITTEANGTAGFSAIQGSNRLADNFTISQPCVIHDISFYGYQTGTVPPSPFTAYTLQIWNGRPGDVGSAVVFGDTTTNRLLTSNDSTYYRLFNTVVPTATPTGTTRKIWKNTVTVGTTLPAGTYWIDWASTVSGGGGHFHPSKTIAGSCGGPLDDARQFDVTTTTWSDAADDGDPLTAADIRQDFPFDVFGDPGNTPTATSTDTPTATPTAGGATPSIDGTITYGNAISNPVPPRFVKNVTVQSTAGSPACWADRYGNSGNIYFDRIWSGGIYDHAD